MYFAAKTLWCDFNLEIIEREREKHIENNNCSVIQNACNEREMAKRMQTTEKSLHSDFLCFKVRRCNKNVQIFFFTLFKLKSALQNAWNASISCKSMGNNLGNAISPPYRRKNYVRNALQQELQEEKDKGKLSKYFNDFSYANGYRSSLKHQAVACMTVFFRYFSLSVYVCLLLFSPTGFFRTNNNKMCNYNCGNETIK